MPSDWRGPRTDPDNRALPDASYNLLHEQDDASRSQKKVFPVASSFHRWGVPLLLPPLRLPRAPTSPPSRGPGLGLPHRLWHWLGPVRVLPVALIRGKGSSRRCFCCWWRFARSFKHGYEFALLPGDLGGLCVCGGGAGTPPPFTRLFSFLFLGDKRFLCVFFWHVSWFDFLFVVTDFCSLT